MLKTAPLCLKIDSIFQLLQFLFISLRRARRTMGKVIRAHLPVCRTVANARRGGGVPGGSDGLSRGGLWPPQPGRDCVRGAGNGHR